MRPRSLSVLVALIPALASASARAADNPDAQQAGLETWSIEQLCDARTRRDVLDELGRREVFDRRELRAIRRETLRTGISDRALLCLKSWPEAIRPEAGNVDGVPVDAYIYPSGEQASLVVFVTREGEASTVAGFTETADPGNAGLWVSGSGSARGATCSGRGTVCVPATGAARQHSSAVSRSSGMADSPPSLPSQ